MWKAACLWLRSPRASNSLLSKTTSGTSRPVVRSPGRGEKCIHYLFWHIQLNPNCVHMWSFFSHFLSLHFCPPLLHILHHPPNILFTCRLCQGLEWMMSRLRVRWWPLTLIKSAPLLFFFFCLQIQTWNKDGDEVCCWMVLSSFLWHWRGQTAARTLYYLLW